MTGLDDTIGLAESARKVKKDYAERKRQEKFLEELRGRKSEQPKALVTSASLEEKDELIIACIWDDKVKKTIGILEKGIHVCLFWVVVVAVIGIGGLLLRFEPVNRVLALIPIAILVILFWTKKKLDNLRIIKVKKSPTVEELKARPAIEDLELDKYREEDFEHSQGRCIKELIYSDKKTLVYLDENNYAQLVSKSDQPPKGANYILSKATQVENTTIEALCEEQKIIAARYVGGALAMAFQDSVEKDKDLDEATKMLNDGEKWIRDRNEEISRGWQIYSSIFIMFILIFGIFYYINHSKVDDINQKALEFLLAAIVGAFGAIFSLVGRTGNLKLDPAAGQFLHFSEVVARIITGGGSAVLVAIAIKANLLFGGMITNTFQLMLFYGIAGFSERLMPNIVKKFESQAIEPQESKMKKGNT